MTQSAALEEMRRELTKVLKAQEQCLTSDGHVRTSHRYRFQDLVKTAAELKGAIEWFEKLYQEKEAVVN